MATASAQDVAAPAPALDSDLEARVRTFHSIIACAVLTPIRLI